MERPARSYLVLDIETSPDPVLYEPPAEPGAPRPFPPLYAHQPIVVGVMWLGPDYRLRRMGVIGEASGEAATLEEFSRFVEEHRPALVTYNGRAFDLPVLALRSLRHGVPMAWYYQGNLHDRASQAGHVDLCDVLADYGAAKAMRLDAMARLIGLPGKIGCDGSQVESLYRAGEIEAIRSYCLMDVAQTALLFLRLRLLEGALTPDEHGAILADLMDHLRREPRLAKLVAALDATGSVAENASQMPRSVALASSM